MRHPTHHNLYTKLIASLLLSEAAVKTRLCRELSGFKFGRTIFDDVIPLVVFRATDYNVSCQQSDLCTGLNHTVW